MRSFAGLRWHEIDADTRADLLAFRYADLLDREGAEKRADPDREHREMVEAHKRAATRSVAADAMRANGSSEAGIARALRDLALD